MERAQIHRLENRVQHYAWGSHTAIPTLLGVASPAAQPWAELWMGAHPKAPSQVASAQGAPGLDTFVAGDPVAVLGQAAAERFAGSLPFLFKVLAAEAPLSIQAHPNLEQAREGFERENRAGIALGARNRCYVDANHKPELICALTPFHALNRFRDPEDVTERLSALDAPELAPLLAALRERPDREGLAALFGSLWQLDAPSLEAVLGCAVARAGERSSDPALGWLAELAARHPGDVGALAPLLLNVVTLEPGTAMYLPAGELHSYLSGVGIEIMANSDNVLRGGLTPKHVDVPELLRTLTFRHGPVDVLAPALSESGVAHYETPAEEFALARIELAPERVFASPEQRAVEILLCTAGAGRVDAARPLEFRRGDCLLVPAQAPAYRLRGEATVYRATTGCGSGRREAAGSG